ncbi:diguanylate cyclase domain-containing protein [Massilia sp. CMS3.1]|uniref:diguanylate cyclase domain-containing protein n=1 Tax=Massilia sp. CMS3.1 TaxID=3373083 RepID=UPI003EE4DEEA
MTTIDNADTTILLIDDDAAMIDYLSILLGDKGSLISALSGETGIALALRIRPDLILLDVSMDGIDGFEVCRRLKEDVSTRNIPILFVTAGDDEEVEVKALELGAADFIAKPLRPSIARARVDTQLALRRSTLMMEELANLDGLTALFNRRFFDGKLETEIARHRRQKQPLAVALIDVDHFKKYNDSLGHQRGDDCLKTIARTLGNCARRPGEVIARYGGEEFVILIPDCAIDDATRYGARLCQMINDLALPHPAAAAHVTISVGIHSQVPDASATGRQFLERADRALYRAKANGRNQSMLVE